MTKIGLIIPYYENQPVMKERLEWLLDMLKYQMDWDETIKEATEVVIVDDGCNARWLDNYKNWFRIIHLEKNCGVSAARNVGLDFFLTAYSLQIHKVDYVGFLDADDSISTDYLKEAYKLMQLGVDFIDSRFVQDGFEIFGTFKGHDNQKKVIRDGVAGCFYKSSLICDTRFDETLQIGEDAKFNKEVVDLKKHKKEISMGIYVYNHGINTDSLTMRHARKEIGKTFECDFLTSLYYKHLENCNNNDLGFVGFQLTYDELNKGGVTLNDCFEFAKKMHLDIKMPSAGVVLFEKEGKL